MKFSNPVSVEIFVLTFNYILYIINNVKQKNRTHMAKFKNKNLGTRKRARDASAIGNDQLRRIDERVRKIEYRDFFTSIGIVILVVTILSALVYALVMLVRGYIL